MKMGRPRIHGVKLVSLRLREQDIKAAKRSARKRALPYQAVIREWVAVQAEQASPGPAARSDWR